MPDALKQSLAKVVHSALRADGVNIFSDASAVLIQLLGVQLPADAVSALVTMQQLVAAQAQAQADAAAPVADDSCDSCEAEVVSE